MTVPGMDLFPAAFPFATLGGPRYFPVFSSPAGARAVTLSFVRQPA
jgi:hypothetical protein